MFKSAADLQHFTMLTFTKVYLAGLFLSNCHKNTSYYFDSRTHMTCVFFILWDCPTDHQPFQIPKLKVTYLNVCKYLLYKLFLVVAYFLCVKAPIPLLDVCRSFHRLANFEPLHRGTNFGRQELLLDVCIFVANQVSGWGMEMDRTPCKETKVPYPSQRPTFLQGFSIITFYLARIFYKICHSIYRDWHRKDWSGYCAKFLAWYPFSSFLSAAEKPCWWRDKNGDATVC